MFGDEVITTTTTWRFNGRQRQLNENVVVFLEGGHRDRGLNRREKQARLRRKGSPA